MFCEDLLFSCCESFLLRLTIASVVLGCWVRWTRAMGKSWPIDMTNWKPVDFLWYTSGLIAGMYISSDGACRMSSRSVLFSLVSPSPNAKWSSEAWRLTSFSRCILNLGLAFTIVSICEKLVTWMNPLELTSMVVCGLIAVLCAAVH